MAKFVNGSVVYMIALYTPRPYQRPRQTVIIIICRETRLKSQEKGHSVREIIKATDCKFSLFQCAIQSSFHIYLRVKGKTNCPFI